MGSFWEGLGPDPQPEVQTGESGPPGVQIPGIWPGGLVDPYLSSFRDPDGTSGTLNTFPRARSRGFIGDMAPNDPFYSDL